MTAAGAAAAAGKAALPLGDSAHDELPGADSFLFFDDSGKVLATSFKVDESELVPLAEVVKCDRADAVSKGMVVGGRRYEVHRHHPPLAYGRTMGHSDPEDSVGAALCAVQRDATGCAAYGFITYRMPAISARMVPLLEAFCEKHLRAPPPA